MTFRGKNISMKSIWRTLLVEDNYNDAFLIMDTLIRSNGIEYETTRADNKADIVAALENKYFDLIIADYHVPGINFDDLIKIILYYNAEDVPLIIVSGSISQSEASSLLGAKTRYMYVNKNELWLLGPYVKQLIQSEDNQYQIIQAFVNALEYRDIITKEHSARVVEFAVELGIRVGVNGSMIRGLRIGSLLHDIGKLGVSDIVLMKPGEFNPNELEAMKKHPEFGYKLLNSIPSLAKYSTIAYCHHERWNGTGYPRGLAGKDIPLFARIFSIVDVYDALISDRPYRNGWDTNKALDYIRSEAGITFDPDIVKVFLEMMNENTKLSWIRK